MLIKYTFLWLIQLITCQKPNMESFIVGGQKARIEQYPHSVYMSATCSKGVLTSHWRCGSSILNQRILLTAAHCLDCSKIQHAMFSVGSSNIRGTYITSADKFTVHPNYKHVKLSHDIAVVKTKGSLPLSQRVSRIALMRNPPYNEQAAVAGWGLKDEHKKTASNYLKFISQKVMTYNECVTVLGQLPPGCLCASNRKRESFASEGDSGSALVVRGFIQIGIVAFKKPLRSMSITAYTDTGFFYDWIKSTAKSLYCH